MGWPPVFPPLSIPFSHTITEAGTPVFAGENIHLWLLLVVQKQMKVPACSIQACEVDGSPVVGKMSSIQPHSDAWRCSSAWLSLHQVGTSAPGWCPAFE